MSEDILKVLAAASAPLDLRSITLAIADADPGIKFLDYRTVGSTLARLVLDRRVRRDSVPGQRRGVYSIA